MASIDRPDQEGASGKPASPGEDSQTESLTQNLLDNIPNCIARFDAECRYLFISPSATRLFALPREHFIGKRISETGKSGDAAQNAELEAMIRRAFAEGVANRCEATWTTVEGERCFEVLHVPERDEAGRVASVLGIAHDITEHKLAEQALCEHEFFLQSLLEAIPLPVFYKDRQGRYLGFNRAYEDFLGVPRDQLVGKNVFDTSPPDLAEIYHAKDNELFEAGGEQRYQSQMRTRAQGDLRDVVFNKAVFTDSQGRTKGLIGTILDITERKKMDEELRASEARVRSFADHAMDAFFLHGEKGVLLDANRQACISLGYSREELIGMDPSQFDADLPPDLRDQLRARADKGEIVTFMSHHRRKDGTTFPVEVRIREFMSGDQPRYLSTARDISERERVEDDLRRLNRELRAISRCHQTLLRAQDEKALLGDICNIICKEAGYRLAWVGYVEHDEDRSIVPMAAAGDDEGYVESLSRSRLTWRGETEAGRGPAGEAVRSGSIVYVSDIATDPRMRPWRERALEHGYRSGFALPMKDEHGSVFGVLLAYSDQMGSIHGNDAGLMTGLSQDLAFGIASLRNRDQRKRAEDSQRILNRELRAMTLCHQTLLRAEDEKSLLGEVCRIICEDAGYRLAWVGYVQHDEAKSVVPMAVAGHDDGYMESIVRSRFTWSGDTAHGRGAAGEAIRSGASVYIADMATDPRIAPWRERALERGYRSSVALPLKYQDQVFGVMMVYAERVDGFSGDDMRLMDELARDLGFGIFVLRNRDQRQQAEESLQDLNRELRAISLCHQTLLRANDEQSLLDDICRLICEEAGYRLAWVGYVEQDEAKSIRPVAWAGFDSGYIRDVGLTWAEDSPLGQGPSGIAARHGEIVYAQDIATDSRMEPWRQAALERGYRASIALPLKQEDGQVFGILTIYAPAPHALTTDEIRLLGELADDMAFGIHVLRGRDERQRAEAEQQRLQEQLLQAQKMESVGRLAGGIAHDFNNMLAAIMGYTELAMDGVHPSHRLHMHLQEIMKAAGRSADLTRQLLAFARRQPALPTVLDLNAKVEGTLMMLRRLIGEDIHLDWRPGEGLRPIKVDPSQVDQILANLCVNARDAIGSIGRIVIETANVRLSEAYCAERLGSTPGDYVSLVVRDDGCGMDSDTLEKVFEPFFTTKAMGQGTGLGLAMVYGIVKQNEGFIEIDSEPGQGTTVQIYLPPHRGEADMADRQEAPAAASVQQGNETILVVEDEAVVLDMARLMLQQCGYGVLEAATPEEASRLAEEHAGKISLLVTDVVMPGMNGQELASLLTEQYPNLKVLFMSGYPGNAIAQHGVVTQRGNFIQKPFTMQDLAAKVREVLDT